MYMAESIVLQSDDTNPFTSQDLLRLHEEASGDMMDKKGWIFLKKTKHVELWKKSNEDSPINLIKGFLHFPGISSHDLLELIVNIDLRRRWEKQFPVLEVIDEKPDYKLIYWLVKTPVGADNRDFVQYMTHGKDENDTLYVLYKNATHDSKPVVPGVIRAQTIFSGTLISPDKDDRDSSRLTLVVQDDLKGHVPKFILNHFYSQAPIDWHRNLTAYYHNVYKKK